MHNMQTQKIILSMGWTQNGLESSKYGPPKNSDMVCIKEINKLIETKEKCYVLLVRFL